MSIETRASCSVKKSGVENSRWTVPLIGPSHATLTSNFFSSNIFPWATVSPPYEFFSYNFKFAEIFEVEEDSAVSVAPLGQKISFTQP